MDREIKRGAPLGALLALAAALGMACSPAGDPASRAAAPEEAPASMAAPVAAEPPAGPGAMAPHLTVDGDELILSWLEPTLATESRAGDSEQPGPKHRFLMSRLQDAGWTDPAVIAEGDDFFANWADVPKVAVAGDGTLWAHWLAKIGDATYAYGIFLARSSDGGATWQPMGMLHGDSSPTEHGFVAYAREGDGLRAVWLDGREMERGEPMTVRSARLDETVGPETIVDERVCECCPTAVAATDGGALALYRDRSADEVRNIGVARFDGTAWSTPAALHDDGWMIPGCPVNGPAVDSAGDEVAVAWFTIVDEAARVQLTFSHDGGTTFRAPRVVDGNRPLGRVDLALEEDASAWVSWLAVRDDLAEVKVAHHRPDGAGEEWTVASTGASRASGIPRLARAGNAFYLAWVETAENSPSSLRLATWPAGGS